jgi:sorting nexin-4
LTYSHANRAVLKLRDQKQLDFEELSAYLSGVTAERDRLAAIISGHAGSSGLGLSAYLKDRVDAFRGADDDRSRVEKMKKLDIKIKEVSHGQWVMEYIPTLFLAPRRRFDST